ncbi:DUF1054 domain-containing protein [Thermoflavimicrobium daqui]|uniref:UPF0637 protein DL897_07910 n=2 Tax=Thermoflavimicrobium daqui TaxID=2137476 RepID=A0A364K6Y4_9BACL|nr:DUF1054 domain-containing protein [Thermoflavimicrobium daqui]
MSIPRFTNTDFAVFQVEGLESRMAKLKEHIQPKFAAIGEEVATFLTTLIQDPFYIHIAKHARRTVNPPDETWVAWATNKRGYKAYPHFQFGLRDSHLFIWFALIYECDRKPAFARQFLAKFDEVWPNIPKYFYISQDHTRPEVTSVNNLQPDEVKTILERLEKVKKAEFLCGTLIPKEEAVTLSGEMLINKIEDTFNKVYPLYQLASTL